jgi:hypothetical protein
MYKGTVCRPVWAIILPLDAIILPLEVIPWVFWAIVRKRKVFAKRWHNETILNKPPNPMALEGPKSGWPRGGYGPVSTV